LPYNVIYLPHGAQSFLRCFKEQWKVFGYVHFKMWAPTEELSKFDIMSFGDNGMYSDERSLTEFHGH